MKLTAFNIAMLVAFAVMLSAKVFEIGIGATLSWSVVTLPLWGPIAALLTIIAVAFALAFIGSMCVLFYDWVVSKK